MNKCIAFLLRHAIVSFICQHIFNSEKSTYLYNLFAFAADDVIIWFITFALRGRIFVIRSGNLKVI